MDVAFAGRVDGGVGVHRHGVPRDGAAGSQKNEIKPWLKKQWVIPPLAGAEFVSKMEDVLDVYRRPVDPARALVCMDEAARQLIGETRVPLAAKPGEVLREDYEYVCNGVANFFMFHAPWRASGM